MKKLVLVIVAAAMASLVFAQDGGPRGGKPGGPGGPQGGPGGPGRGRFNPGQMAEALGLSDAQKKQLKTLNEQRRTSMEAIFKKYNIQRPNFGGGKPGGKPGAGGPPAGGPPPGGPGGRPQLPEAAKADMKKVQETFQAGLKKILTPAQFQKMQSMMPQGRGFGGAKGGAKGPNKAKP